MKMILVPLSGALAAMMLLTGCAGNKDTPQLGSTPGPVYETAAQIKAMPRCKAKVVERGPCFLTLTTANGQSFYLGSPASKEDVDRFLGTLKDGHSYIFPDVFLQYQKDHPAP